MIWLSITFEKPQSHSKAKAASSSQKSSLILSKTELWVVRGRILELGSLTWCQHHKGRNILKINLSKKATQLCWDRGLLWRICTRGTLNTPIFEKLVCRSDSVPNHKLELIQSTQDLASRGNPVNWKVILSLCFHCNSNTQWIKD